MGFARSALVLLIAASLAGCGGSAPATFDLSPATPGPLRAVRAQLRVREPTAAAELNSDRILVRTGTDGLAVLAGAQWPDRLPLVLQARLAATFQNTAGLRAVGESAAADYDVVEDIRAFELDAGPREVSIEIAVKLVSTVGGRVIATRIFQARAPVASTAPAVVTAALNQAQTGVMAQIVAFVAAKL